MSIRDSLKRWAASPSGKARLDEAARKIIESGNGIRGGRGKGTYIMPSTAAALFKNTVIKCAREDNVPQSVLNDIASMVCTEPKFSDGTGYYEVDIYFSNNLHRESLYEEGYPDGISNIIALFNNGYLASDYVYGVWLDGGIHMMNARSLIARSGLQFLQRAVEEFNYKYGKGGYIVIQLASIYEETPRTIAASGKKKR